MLPPPPPVPGTSGLSAQWGWLHTRPLSRVSKALGACCATGSSRAGGLRVAVQQGAGVGRGAGLQDTGLGQGAGQGSVYSPPGGLCAQSGARGRCQASDTCPGSGGVRPSVLVHAGPRPPSNKGLSNKGSQRSKPGWWAQAAQPGSWVTKAVCPRSGRQAAPGRHRRRAGPPLGGMGVQQPTGQGGPTGAGEEAGARVGLRAPQASWAARPWGLRVPCPLLQPLLSHLLPCLGAPPASLGWDP